MAGLNTKFVEGADHEFAIQRSQDVEPILNYTKEMNRIGAGKGADLRHCAEIPMIIVENYMQRTGITFREFTESQDHIKAVVNDPALRDFRIWEGIV
jgi:hypothetical protein